MRVEPPRLLLESNLLVVGVQTLDVSTPGLPTNKLALAKQMEHNLVKHDTGH